MAGKVLVVEDDKGVQEMLRLSLLRAGFDVDQALTATEALGLLEQHPIDAVVLDPGLGDDKGAVLIERLRELRQRDQHPVWVVISSLDREEAEGRYEIEESRFLAKPFNPWDLVRVLEDMLARGS